MRLKSEEASFTFIEVGKLVEKAFNLYKNSVPTLKDVTFYREYPLGTDPKKLQLPAVTYRIENKRTMAGAEIKPRQREQITDPNNEGYILQIKGKRYDGSVRFDIWSNQNFQADDIADEFEKFIDAFVGYFKEQGLVQIIYEGSYNSTAEDYRDSLIHIYVKYRIVLEQQYIISTKTIEDIKIKLQKLT